MDSERQSIVNALNAKDARLYFYEKTKRGAKSEILSAHYVKRGHEDFANSKHNAKGHARTLNSYALAVAYGPLESEELALAYLGRAKFLLHVNKYHEALNDTERALSIAKSNCLKVSLHCIQTQCYIELERPEQRAAFVKAKFLFNRIDDNEKEKKQLKVLIDFLEEIVEDGDPEYTRKTEKKKGIDIEEILSKKEAENPFKSLSIRYNEKDGRHLVAARSIKAGEIISVLKPYAINSNTELTPYIFCCHCMKVKWDTVPCNVCGWCFFCSAECRDEAWQQYHDMECSVLPKIRHTAEHQHLRQLTVRTLIIAVRQADGISELRRQLQEIDKCSDKRTCGFSKNGKFENDKFISIYSLISRKSASLAKVHVNDAVKILIIFAKNTNLFGSPDKFKTVSELLANEDALFIGSLILRLFGIFSVNYQEVWENNPLCQEKHDRKLCLKKRCCYRTSMISSLFSLINHSCNPNAAVLYTDANKLMLVALKPLNKNDQIYQAYSGCGSYFEKDRADRQWMCKNAYNFTCECEACNNNWPLLESLNPVDEKLLSDIQKPCKLIGEKEKKLKDLSINIKEGNIKFDKSSLKDLGNAIDIAARNYVEPSFTINILVNALAMGYKKLFFKKFRYPQYCDIYELKNLFY